MKINQLNARRKGERKVCVSFWGWVKKKQWFSMDLKSTMDCLKRMQGLGEEIFEIFKLYRIIFP